MSAPNEKTPAKKAGKEIPHPRRILAVSLAQSAGELSAVIKELTGSHPLPSDSTDDENTPSLAGTTHLLPLSTQYYTASVPIWLDLVSSPQEWSSSFLSEEAKEVLLVLGGVIIVVELSPCLSSSISTSTVTEHQRLVKEVGKVVREGLGGWEWDGVGLVIGVSQQAIMGDDDVLDEWEDVAAEAGLEFVVYTKGREQEEGKRNEFGERMGIARVREALEANDWSGGGAPGEEGDGLGFGEGDEDDDKEFDPKGLGYGYDREDFEGLKRAIWEQIGEEIDTTGEGKGKEEEGEEEIGDDDIRSLEQMMVKLRAVRDMSAGLPEQQRKRMAKQVVEEVMREL
uniref:Increased recombination centers protein 6 n=2 Tax=Podospora anserina (strain S / ATCC MYA-4624 / DSM 980 / FGSC 10383) TaxID=515849 RepID=A0A090CCU6_PODAN|nr:Putative protein of unknown function [Podospora anserina S mat+]